MNLLFIVLAMLAGVGILAYLRAPLSIATLAAGIGLFVIGKLAAGFLSGAFMFVAWLGWVAVLAMNIEEVRKKYFSRRAFAYFKNALPAVSQTEQDALDAGTVWWDAELFSGAPNWSRLLTLPAESLSGDERAFIDGPVDELCSMLNDWDISHVRGDLPPEVWRFIKQQGFLGMIIPKEYGGLGFSARAHSRVIMKLSTRCGAAAVSVMVPNSLGPAELLLRYGTDGQKEHYLSRLARGEEVPCFALTNPFAGSDAASIPDFGIVCRGEFAGEEVLGVRVTWEKRYITLGPVATVLGLAFHLYDPERLLGDREDVGITLALLPTSHPGVAIGRRHYAARQAFLVGPNSGSDVFIPMDWIIGGKERCGDGWRMLMNCLAAGRSISLPASSTAALKICGYTAGAYAAVREQFNVPIAKFEGIQEALARIAGNAYLVDAARDVTAGAVDQGEEPSVLSALLKYQATERMRAGINDALDIHGGRGICDGPSNYLMNAYAAAPIAITVEGANILSRSLIVFGQGVIRCHPWLLKEIKAANDTNAERGLANFDKAIMSHIGGLLSNAVRAFFKNATGGFMGSDPSVGEVNYWYAQLERTSASFALLTECALIQFGGALKRKEKLSGRFADVLGELYLLSCALKRFEDRGRPAAEIPLVDYVFRNGLAVVQTRFDEILNNFPSRLLAWVTRRLIFPWGRRWKPADDALIATAASLLVEPGEVRQRVADGMYLDDSPDDAIGCLAHAIRLARETEAPSSKIRKAQKEGRLSAYAADLYGDAERAGVVSVAQAESLREAHVALRRAIDVDDFDTRELWPSAIAGQQGGDVA